MFVGWCLASTSESLAGVVSGTWKSVTVLDTISFEPHRGKAALSLSGQQGPRSRVIGPS